MFAKKKKNNGPGSKRKICNELCKRKHTDRTLANVILNIIRQFSAERINITQLLLLGRVWKR